MRLINKTAYDTKDLRKFIAACIRHMGSSPDTEITVVYRRGTSDFVTGWATYTGFKMRLRLPKPGKLRLIDLAYVLEHEVSHNLGVRHSEMSRECFNCHPSSTDQLPTWAVGLNIAVKAPKAKPTMEDRVAKRAAKAVAMLKKWDRKLKLAQTMRLKWCRKVNHYGLKIQRAAAPGVCR